KIFSVWFGQPASWTDFYRHFALLERPTEFRFYAPAARVQGSEVRNFHGVIAEDWQGDFDFGALMGTLIVENFETFLAEAQVSRDRLILWGAGWRAASLRGLQARCPRPILYWGDLDKEGYEIYGFLKSFIADLTPTLMDRRTLERYRHLAITKEKFFGPFRSAADLQSEYQEVSRLGLAIEQEKIHDRPY